MRDSDGKLCFCEKERVDVWKDYMKNERMNEKDHERIMNVENDWDHNVDGNAVEGPVVCVGREEVLQALN